jgi:tetratricopeptide (TPR) repeat protein
MAYRKLGAVLIGSQQESARWVDALTRAFEHRDRLTDPERYLTMGTYYWYVRRDRDQAINAYRTLLQTYPDDFRALHNLAIIYSGARNWREAEELELRGLRVAPDNLLAYGSAMTAQVAQGKFATAESTLVLAKERFPGNPRVGVATALLASARGNYAEAEGRIGAIRESQRGSLTWRVETSDWLANLALIRGGITEAERHLRDRMRTEEERGLPGEYLEAAVSLASLDVAFRDDASRAWAQIESAFERHPLHSVPPSDRPYRWLAYIAARADRPALARQYLREYEMAVGVELPGYLAGPSPTHVSGGCVLCVLPDLARAFDRAGQSDSAIAVYERYLTTPTLFRVYFDSYDLAPSYKRLGELHEERGERDKAVEYYGRFVELWSEADPELQPVVEDVRGRIARLVGER